MSSTTSLIDDLKNALDSDDKVAVKDTLAQLQSTLTSKSVTQLTTDDLLAIGNILITKLGLTRLSINFLELFSSLVFTNNMITYSLVTDIPIPAGFIFSVAISPPHNTIVLTSEFSLTVSRDLVIAVDIFIDGYHNHTDPAIIGSLYQFPINFFKIGALLPVKNVLSVTLTNNDVVTQTLYYWIKYGQIDTKLYTQIMTRYFQVIVQEANKVIV